MGKSKWVAASTSAGEEGDAVSLELGWVSRAEAARVSVTPERIFGRHCAILGTTGGGKSFSLARLVEQSARYPCKAIVLDASGEYDFEGPTVTRLMLGPKSLSNCPAGFQLVSLPYRHLTMPDLFAIFQPSGGSQAPVLRQAIYSLKLKHLVPPVDWGDLLVGTIICKAEKVRAKCNSAAKNHVANARKDGADFDIT